MPRKSVFCIAQSDAQAINIVQQLKTAGFRPDDISVLFPDKQGTRDFAHEQQTKAPEGAVTGASTGGVLGGALGWLAGIGALAIPGVGPFIAAGPIMAALGGAAVGAAVGGITGALVGMGIPEYEAKRYEGKIRSGNILISVHSDTAKNADKARTIFEKAGAQDISSSGEATVKTKSGKEEREPVAERTNLKSRSKNGVTENGQTSAAAPATATAGAPVTSGASRTRPATPPVISSAPRTASPSTSSNSNPTPEEISARAFEIYVRKGRLEGRDTENWLEAEAELKAEKHAASPSSSRR
ncbi:MAG: hypothetical protein JWQ71_1078 [Pedosphaera sp.]|nr:hypothetical protein [Pedosphaera sp.]